MANKELFVIFCFVLVSNSALNEDVCFQSRETLLSVPLNHNVFFLNHAISLLQDCSFVLCSWYFRLLLNSSSVLTFILFVSVGVGCLLWQFCPRDWNPAAVIDWFFVTPVEVGVWVSSNNACPIALLDLRELIGQSCFNGTVRVWPP